MNVHTVTHVFHINIGSSALLTKLHYGSYKLARTVNIDIGNRLERFGYDCRIGIIGRVVHHYRIAVCKMKFIFNARSGCDKIKIIFTLKSFLNDLHVQKSQKTATETEAERSRGLGLEKQGRIVKLKSLQSLAQIGIFSSVLRIDTAENYRLNLTVALERSISHAVCQGDSITDTRFGNRFDRSRKIANLSCFKTVAGLKAGSALTSYLDHIKIGTCCHHADTVACLKLTAYHTEINYDTLVCIIV